MEVQCDIVSTEMEYAQSVKTGISRINACRTATAWAMAHCYRSIHRTLLPGGRPGGGGQKCNNTVTTV
jgi:hypothetical protein